MRTILLIGLGVFICLSTLPAQTIDATSDLVTGTDTGETSGFPAEEEAFSFDEGEASFEEDAFDEEADFDTGEEEDEKEDSFLEDLLSSARFTLKHEISYKAEEITGIQNNRSSIRLEYSRFFLDNYFLQFDTKLNAFWGNDHRAEAEDEESFVEPYTREAFLQASFGDTSIKAGIQIMIWGESDGGTITDVISPRDYSEFFLISLEESRIGQPMVILDQYSSIGDWSLFYISDPKFNEYPAEGTAFYFDPFAGQAEFRDGTSDDPIHEYGLRWKKTFGKSDISLMVASLLENDYVYRLDGATTGGKMLITKTEQRFSMVGVTFNYAKGNFLYKGEIGKKMPLSFNDTAYQIVKRDVVDTALGAEYSPGGTYTLGVEMVNSHIQEWSEELQGIKEDTNSVVLVWSKNFLNEDLSITWMSSYSNPHVAFIHALTSSYKWNDNITTYFEAFYPDVQDEENQLWVYRDQKHLVFKMQYQF
jgi:uncharacterized protein DUF1302